MFRVMLFWLMILSALPAAARMYQWVDPETDTTQLSGMPPTWYRGTEPGPRVIVFDRGRVVDDTGIAVSEPERERLRLDAFVQAERDRQAAEEKLRQANQLKAAFDRQRAAEEEQLAEESLILEPAPEAVPQQSPAAVPAGPSIEELRALVRQWEEFRAQSARQIVGENPPPPAD